MKLEIIRSKKSGYASAYYFVNLTEGDWPSDNDLLTIADNYSSKGSFDSKVNQIGQACHFGGKVNLCEPDEKGAYKAKQVTVYID